MNTYFMLIFIHQPFPFSNVTFIIVFFFLYFMYRPNMTYILTFCALCYNRIHSSFHIACLFFFFFICYVRTKRHLYMSFNDLRNVSTSNIERVVVITLRAQSELKLYTFTHRVLWMIWFCCCCCCCCYHHI